MTESYKVAEKANESRSWTLPYEVMKKLRLTENREVVLRCGTSLAKARVTSCSTNSIPIQMWLSSDLLAALGIPPGIYLQIKPYENKEFRLGPVIGILAFSQHIPEKLNYYKNYALVGNTMGLVFVFRRSGINTAANTISGYYFNHSEKAWNPASFPFPDAVIDRCYPNSKASHRMLEKVIGPNRIFNKRSLISKAKFARVMRKDSYLSHWVPKTRIMTRLQDLDYFIGKYGCAILKPNTAMKGKGIMMVTASSGKLELKYKEGGQDVVKVIDYPTTMGQLIPYEAKRKWACLIQQPIRSMDYQGSPFSLRFCPTKNGQGQWEIPGILALGCGNSFVTNYSSGAQAVPLKQLFDSVIPRLQCSSQEFFSLLDSLSIKTAKLLDKYYGPLGELGIDIIIDETGKPWILEANGNPGRIPIFTQIEYPDWPLKLFQYPLSYASLLAGFS